MHHSIAMVGENTVIVRHLPACLTPAEKTDLLQYFGAKEVRVMPCHGRMKHTAFATFGDCDDAKKAIARLHQVELHDSVLSVEFAKEKSAVNTSSQTSNTNQKPTQDEKVDKPGKDKGIDTSPIAPHLGIHYPSDPGLKYCYPPVNGDILLNICSALAAVPKFYTQVLERIREIYQISPEIFVTSVRPAEMPKDPDKLEVIEMSESESEYESNESEGDDKLRALNMDVPDRVIRTRKRKLRNSEDRIKRRKLEQLVKKPTPVDLSADCMQNARYARRGQSSRTSLPSTAAKTANVSDAFGETASVPAPISEDVAASVIAQHNTRSTEGFGKIQPANLTQTDLDNIDDDKREEKVLKDFITRKHLSCGRLSEKDMRSSSLFENYAAGAATCRLYVKNLSKRVTEKDLEFIYGSFVNYDKEHERNSFNIQLLKQGRMKGQAFVSFSSVETADDALRQTNGYQLLNKPMVVHFARSKKPKEPQK